MPAAPARVVSCLQKSVSLHLTAIEHYTTVAEHLERWGYLQLGKRFRDEAKFERHHLRALLSRLEFYDQAAILTHDAPSWPRGDVVGILNASLVMEASAAAVERQNIVDARAVGDEGSAVVFVELLAESEQSIRELEADVRTITQIGLDNWLSLQV